MVTGPRRAPCAPRAWGLRAVVLSALGLLVSGESRAVGAGPAFASRTATAAPDSAPARDRSRELPVVVALDPGHGGTNLGAPGAGRGVYEKNVTLALAERIRALLQAEQAQQAKQARPISVVLCRASDVLVPIRARARCAQDSGARAFVSLHANAVPAGVPPGSQRGFEVFVLGPREVEDDATLASLGRRDDADAVWAAHEVRAAAEQSLVLGRVIAGSLTRALGLGARRGIKQAGAALDVLRGTGTAAALVEVGFLDHPDEGARLATPAGREPIARALADAIREYVDGGDPGGDPQGGP